MSTTGMIILLIIVAILGFFAGFLWGTRDMLQRIRKARQETYESTKANQIYNMRF